MSTLRNELLQVMQQKNYSERTIKSYISTLCRLSRHYNKSPDQLTVREVNDYIYSCITAKGLSNSLANQVIGAFRVLIVNVLKREWVSLGFPIMLAYSAGLRVSEVLSLTPSDIDSQRMQIIVRQAKGNKDRNVILSEQVLLQLRKYWKKYRPYEYLFEGQIRNQHYSQASAQLLVKKAAKLANITRQITFHTLRHSFATHLVEDG